MKTNGVRWKLVVMSAWIAVNISLLQLGLGACFGDQTCHYAQSEVLTVCFMLSLPGGLVSGVVAACLLSGAFDAENLIGFWLAFFIGGYIQWFVLLPRLLKGFKPQTLGLTETKATSVLTETIQLSMLTDAKTAQVTMEAISPQPLNLVAAKTAITEAINPNPQTQQKARKRLLKPPDPRKLTPAFDKRGLTPLQRALRSSGSSR